MPEYVWKSAKIDFTHVGQNYSLQDSLVRRPIDNFQEPEYIEPHPLQWQILRLSGNKIYLTTAFRSFIDKFFYFIFNLEKNQDKIRIEFG